MPTQDAGHLVERLAALEQASDERRAELRRLAQQIPVAISRRSLVTAVARDLRSAPDKSMILRRGVRKLLRAPAALARRLARS